MFFVWVCRRLGVCVGSECGDAVCFVYCNLSVWLWTGNGGFCNVQFCYVNVFLL